MRGGPVTRGDQAECRATTRPALPQGDAAAWNRAAEAYRTAYAAESSDDRRDLLHRCGQHMMAVFQVHHPDLQWWHLEEVSQSLPEAIRWTDPARHLGPRVPSCRCDAPTTALTASADRRSTIRSHHGRSRTQLVPGFVVGRHDLDDDLYRRHERVARSLTEVGTVGNAVVLGEPRFNGPLPRSPAARECDRRRSLSCSSRSPCDGCGAGTTW